MHRNTWLLDPQLAMLNHGSFGACPRAVFESQQLLREQIERDPMHFFTRQMQPLLDQSRSALADLIGAEPADLVFVRNATSGVNAVLRSLKFRPGDEILVTDHGYNACRNVVEYVARQTGACVIVASIPLPIQSPEQVVDAVIDRVSDRTRLALLDHITSPTGVIFPLHALVRRLDELGVDTLVDGAHAPGMVALDLTSIGAAYYTGNCHKWLCAPKGSGFLYVRPDRQEHIQPPVISHGFNSPRPGHCRFHDAFDWNGTDDPTPWLCTGEAIRFMESLLPGGIAAMMERNHDLAVAGQRLLCNALGFRPVCGETMLGSLAAMLLPDDPSGAAALDTGTTPTATHRLQVQLRRQFKIDVPVYYWPTPPQTILRISAQAYNDLEQYQCLADALRQIR